MREAAKTEGLHEDFSNFLVKASFASPDSVQRYVDELKSGAIHPIKGKRNG